MRSTITAAGPSFTSITTADKPSLGIGTVIKSSSGRLRRSTTAINNNSNHHKDHHHTSKRNINLYNLNLIEIYHISKKNTVRETHITCHRWWGITLASLNL